MPRSRTPIEKARVTGQAQRRKSKFAVRRDVCSLEPLGEPPAWMGADQKTAWRIFDRECPWLNRSHRGVIEIGSVIRGQMLSGEMPGVNKLNLLRQILGSLGATPADASRVQASAGDDDDDPADEYFN